MSLSRKKEEQIIKETAREKYESCREEYRKALEMYEFLFKEWKRTGDKEIGEKSDVAYGNLRNIEDYKKILAVVLLERLIDNGII